MLDVDFELWDFKEFEVEISFRQNAEFVSNPNWVFETCVDLALLDKKTNKGEVELNFLEVPFGCWEPALI